MDLQCRKTGILLAAAPGTPDFAKGVKAAASSLASGARTYLFCIDDAVSGVGDSELQSLCQRGLILYACAYGANRRKIPIDDAATFAGLGALGDIIAGTDEFLSFTGAVG